MMEEDSRYVRQQEKLFDNLRQFRADVVAWEKKHGSTTCDNNGDDAERECKQQQPKRPFEGKTKSHSYTSPRKLKRGGGKGHVVVGTKTNIEKWNRVFEGAKTISSNNNKVEKKRGKSEKKELLKKQQQQHLVTNNRGEGDEKTLVIKDEVLLHSFSSFDSRPFVPNQVASSKYYIGNGQYEWRRCRLLKFKGLQEEYLIEWISQEDDGKRKQKWASWTNVWMSEVETLEQYEELLKSALENNRGKVHSLLFDPNVSIPSETKGKSLGLLTQHLGTVPSEIVKRVVYLSKPTHFKFKEKFKNSPVLWSTLLEQVNDQYMHAQYSSTVKYKTFGLGCLREDYQKTKYSIRQKYCRGGSIKAVKRKILESSCRFDQHCITCLLLLKNAASVDFIKSKLLFREIPSDSQPVYVDEFLVEQNKSLKLSLDRLRSNWFIEVYHRVKDSVLSKTKHSIESNFIKRFLRLVRIIMSDILDSILVESINAFRKTFTHRVLPVFKIDARFQVTNLDLLEEEEKLKKKRLLKPNDTSNNKAKKAKQRASINPTEEDDWIALDIIHEEAVAAEALREENNTGLLLSDSDNEKNDSASSSSDSDDGGGYDVRRKSFRRGMMGVDKHSQKQIMERQRVEDEEKLQLLEGEVYVEIQLEPKCETYTKTLADFFDSFTKSLERFPSIEAMVLEDEQLEEEPPTFLSQRHQVLIQQVKETTADVIHSTFRRPIGFCLDYSEEFREKLLDIDTLAKSKLFYSEAETLDLSLKFHLLSLELNKLKHEFFSRSTRIREIYLGRILKASLKACDKIAKQYDFAHRQISKKAKTIDDLELIHDQIERIPVQVEKLQKKINKHVLKPFQQLETERYEIEEKQWNRHWQVVGMPRHLTARAANVYADIESKKRELKSNLVDQLSKRHKRLLEYKGYMEKAAKFTDLNNVEEYAVNMAMFMDNLQTFRLENKDIQKRAMIFDMVEDYQKTHDLTEKLMEQIEPLAELWGKAADVAELYHLWFKGSIMKLDVDDVLDKIEHVRQDEKLRNDFAGDVAVWLENKMQKMLETQQIVRIVNGKGLSKEHWKEFSIRNGTEYFMPTLETTLEDILLDHEDIVDNLDDLETLGKIAEAQYNHQDTLDKMESELRHLQARLRIADNAEFAQSQTVHHQEDPTKTAKPWQMEVVVARQLKELENMRKEEFVEELLPRIRVWEEYIRQQLTLIWEEERKRVQKSKEELEMVRKQEPKLYLLSDQSINDMKGKIDILSLLPKLYPFYGTPAHMIQSRNNRRNLFNDASSIMTMSVHSMDSQSTAGGSSGSSQRDVTNIRRVRRRKKMQMISSVVNDIGEQFQLRGNCEAASFQAVEYAISQMLKSELAECLRYVSNCTQIQKNDDDDDDESNNDILSSMDDDENIKFCSFPKQFTTKMIIEMCSNWPKQVCELVVRILFSESCRKIKSCEKLDTEKKKQMAWEQVIYSDTKAIVHAYKTLVSEVSTKQLPSFRRLQESKKKTNLSSQVNLVASTRTLETLLLLGLNEKDQSLNNRCFDYENSKFGVVEVRMEPDDPLGSCFYSFEIVSGKLPTLLVLPSCKWAFSIMKTFYHAKQSLIIEEPDVGTVISFAAALGKHCYSIECDSLGELYRVQDGILLTSAWVILQERCSWIELAKFDIEKNGVVLSTRKPKLPKNLHDALMICEVNVDLEVLKKQCLFRARMGPEEENNNNNFKSSSSRRVGSIYARSDSNIMLQEASNNDNKKHIDDDDDGDFRSEHILELFLSRMSQAKVWEHIIFQFLQRIDEKLWKGNPSRIIIHDAKADFEKLKNPECIEMLENLVKKKLLQDVTIEYKFNRYNFVPQATQIDEMPNSFEHLTLVLLGEENDGPYVSYLVDIPDDSKLEEANQLGKESKLKIILFDNSQELCDLEVDFPRIKRFAKRLKLHPWWLDKKGLEQHTDYEDEQSTKSLIAETFLEKIVQVGVRPDHYYKFTNLIKDTLPQRLFDISEQIKARTKILEELYVLEKLANKKIASKQHLARLGELQPVKEDTKKEIEQFTLEIKTAPKIIVNEIADNFKI